MREFKPSEEFLTILLNIGAVTALRSALFPYEEVEKSKTFGSSGKVVDLQQVEESYGVDAAVAWQECRDAGKRFLTIAKKGPK